WLPAHPKKRLRILSVPCASGEEPYSIIMALLDAGLQVEQFDVQGADISPRSLARARAAVYGRNSFRGDDLGFRDRFFKQTRDGYALEPRVRDAVRFFEGNLLSAQFLTDSQTYDFVFCRNLLIYLDPVNRARVLNKLAGILAPSGVLI